MESVIILAGLIVMSVIDIKRKSIHIGMLTAMGVIVAGIRVVQSVCGTAKLNKYELLVITGLTLVMSLMCAITHMLGVADAVVSLYYFHIWGLHYADKSVVYGGKCSDSAYVYDNNYDNAEAVLRYA